METPHSGNSAISASGAAEERKRFRESYRVFSRLVLGCVVLGLLASLNPSHFPSLALQTSQTFWEIPQHLLNELLFSLNPPEMVSIAYEQEPCIVHAQNKDEATGFRLEYSKDQSR